MRVFLMCLAVSAIAGMAAAQFTSGVNLVEVYATVVDERGEPVSGLTADDFIVEENGRPQRIEAFTAGDFPLALAVAVDRSFSVSPTRLRDEVYAVQRLLGELRPEDRVLLLAIGSEVEVLSPLSTDHLAAYEALRDLQPWGTTPLFDATLQAIDAVQGASGRRALILVSDGDDRYSAITAPEMVGRARAKDVLVYPVVLQRRVPPVLVELATVTGGRSVPVADARALSASLSGIASELRRQYLIGYTPRPAGDRGTAAPDRTASRTERGEWRSISVRVTRPNLRVRAREGYYALP